MRSTPVLSKMYKPSKASKHELKKIISGLKEEPTLILTRRALRYIPSFLKSTGLTKKLLKEVIRLWAESHEKIRVICLLCIIRIFRKQERSIKEIISKRMYTSYVTIHKGSRINAQTLPLLVFMRQSLVEVYSLDPSLAYKQAFVFCKQLASKLKNAYENKTETYKDVYNWQFINCLSLWSNLVSSLMPNKQIEQLLNPLIQLHIGTINLVSSPRYYPLYLHLIANLVNLNVKLDVYIPILPLLTSILDKLKFNQNRKSGKNSETINFDTLTHVSVEEAKSNPYITATANQVYDLLVKYLASQSHKIAFPELCLLPRMQIKKFIKENKKECEKFRDLATKLEDNIKFIEDRRQSVDFSFTDFAAIDVWEKTTKDTGKLALVKLTSKLHAEKAALNLALEVDEEDAVDDQDEDQVEEDGYSDESDSHVDEFFGDGGTHACDGDDGGGSSSDGDG